MSDSISIVSLIHDVVQRRSIVQLVWDNDPEKRIGLPVPFGTSLDDIDAEAQKALKVFTATLGATEVRPVGAPGVQPAKKH